MTTTRVVSGRGSRAGTARALAALLAAALAGAVGSALALRSAVAAWRLSTPVPYEDQWEFVDDLMRFRAGQYGILDLFSFQNEHRIFTARLSFFADYFLFDLGNRSVVATTYLVLGVLAAIMAQVAARERPFGVRAAVLAVVLASLWSLAGWINLGWAFQLQWAYVHCLPALAIVLFAAAGRRRGRAAWVLLAGACFGDALGVVSMASGLGTIVPVAAVALWTRARPALFIAFGLVHAAAAALYLQGYESADHPLTLDPLRLLAYVVHYLGTALPGGGVASSLLGSAGLVLALVVVPAVTVRALRGSTCETGTAALLGIALFVLTESLMTAAGRADSPDPLASALRYGTPSEVFWTASTLAAWRSLVLGKRLWAARGLAASAVCGVVAGNFAGASHAAWAQWSGAVSNEGFNIIDGVTTGPSALFTYPQPDLIQDRFAFLRDQRLGPFAPAQSRFRIPRERLAGLRPADLPVCAGTTDVYERRDGLVHVQGWAAAAEGAPRPAVGVAAIGRDGALRGYAVPWQLRWDERRVSGSPVVEGFDFWFPAPDEGAPAPALVALFPPGTAPPCRAPAVAGAAGPAPG